MGTKKGKELIMTNEDLLASLIIIFNAFKDKIATKDKILIEKHIDKLKKQSKVIYSHTITTTALKGIMRLYICNSSIVTYCNGTTLAETTNLHKGKQYRVTVEELKKPTKKKK